MDDRTQLVIWAAGFFDGEGSISIMRRLNRPDQPFAQPHVYYVRVGVNQKVRHPIDLLQALFGGAVHAYANRYGPMFQWGATTRVAAAMLAEVRPYLRVKAEQADLALAFQARRAPRGGIRGGGFGRGGRSADPDLDERDRLRLIGLNRGIA